jgi:heme/copper-type cytochrome/quinol oxidase subunit 3
MGDELDIKDIRRMNLVGIIFFTLFGGMVVIMSSYSIYLSYKHSLEFDNFIDYSRDLNMTMILLGIIVISSILLYKYTVVGLDRGNYKTAKRCLIIGIIFGWIGWFIPSIVFYKSYRAFDNAIKQDNKIGVNNTYVP